MFHHPPVASCSSSGARRSSAPPCSPPAATTTAVTTRPRPAHRRPHGTPPPSGAPATTAAPPTTTDRGGSQDLVLARTAASLEQLAVDAYGAAGALLTTRPIKRAATLFAEHHQLHLDALNGAITGAGGEAVTMRNQAVYDALVKPAIDAARTESDAVNLALQLEEAAAQTYVFAGGHYPRPTALDDHDDRRRRSPPRGRATDGGPWSAPAGRLPDQRAFFPGDNPLAGISGALITTEMSSVRTLTSTASVPRILAGAAAASTLLGGFAHLRLYNDGYKDIPVGNIGEHSSSTRSVRWRSRSGSSQPSSCRIVPRWVGHLAAAAASLGAPSRSSRSSSPVRAADGSGSPINPV